MTWLWILAVLALWLAVAVTLALVIGRAVRLADRRSPHRGAELAATDLPAAVVTPAPATSRVRRRTVPLPPVGVALAAVAVTLMTVGYGIRLAGASGPVAHLLSMTAPSSLPRLFVAGLFAAAALAAVAGAARHPGRRTWWLAVGLVAAGLAAIKGGSVMHSDAVDALATTAGAGAAIVISVVVAAAGVGALFLLSRGERRDRRRVLGSLAGYGVASVGLAALSSFVPGPFAATATFLEESGEALAGVAFLMAVLVGVAPQLVLPADWALRRTADARSLQPAQPAVRPVGDPTR